MEGDPTPPESSTKQNWMSGTSKMSCVPDPGAYLSDERSTTDDGSPMRGSRWMNQRQRRAAILATARQLFAQNGYDRFHVRELAGLCNLSAQTIYNLIGDRDRVLHEAMREHIRAMVTSATKQSDRYPNVALALGDMFCVTAERYPEYSRQMSISFSCSSRPLFEVISNCTFPTLFSALTRLQLRDRLRNHVDPRVLTERIAALGAVSMLHWADGRRNSSELRRDVGLGWGLVLLGAVEPREQPQIEDWLGSLESPRSEQALA